MGHAVRMFAFVVVICAGAAWVVSQRDQFAGSDSGAAGDGLIERVLTGSGLTGGGLAGSDTTDSGLIKRILTESGLTDSGPTGNDVIEKALKEAGQTDKRRTNSTTIGQGTIGDQPNQYRPPAESSGDEVVVAQTTRALRLQARANGHFYLEALVNGARIPFLVDTGASSVMLSKKAARQARINPSRDQYTMRARTANGTVRMAPVTLREMRVGQFRISNVEGAVNEAKMGISLLGMSFLNRLRRYEVKGNEMILYW